MCVSRQGCSVDIVPPKPWPTPVRENPNAVHALHDFESQLGLPEAMNFSPMPPVKPAKEEGLKFDTGKLDFTLLPWESLEEVVKVLEFGKAKYGRENWKKLDNFTPRYLAAAFRHLVAMLRGEQVDHESGLLHSAHLACNVLFIIWGAKNENTSR